MRLAALFLPCLVLAGASCQRVTERGNNTPSAISLVPDASLRETRWVLRQVSGQPVPEAASPGQEPYMFISAAGTAEGQGGCNRFRAGLKPATDDGELQFAPLLSTRMACPAIKTENEFTRALAQSRTYRISGDTLRLFDATNAPVARLEAVYLH